MGDDEILQLFYHRVEYAISAVEEKYGRLCRSVARGILKDERDVEECVNDTCMRAWNAIPPEKPRSLEAYLVRITRNLALDRYAYHHSQKRETALTEAYEELEACLPLAKDGPEEAKRQYHIHSQMLHSWKLVFPQMEEPLAYLSGKSFKAPLPGEFTRVLGSLPEGVR